METLVCEDVACLSRLRIGRVLEAPVLYAGVARYCPYCGSAATIHKDIDEDWWESLSQAYELPVDIVKAIYCVWDMKGYPKFGDFVQLVKDEAKVINDDNSKSA